MQALPLFPLATVVVPGGLLALRIFEERYLHLLADLEQRPAPERLFGVVAIQRGHEVGPGRAGTLHRVGTAVSIESLACTGPVVQVSARGLCRFRLQEVDEHSRPYAVAAVNWLAELVGDAEAARTASVRLQRAYAAYAAASAAAPLPPGMGEADPADVAYAVLDRLSLPLPERQAVLEAATTAGQLAALVALVTRETGLVTRFAAIPGLPDPGRESLN